LKGLYPSCKLIDRVKYFLKSKCPGLDDKTIGRVKLLTHLTYFGYCFNPLSVFYVFKAEDPSELLCVIAEVSNTPWIEQHAYALHESVSGVTVRRSPGSFHAVWNKGATGGMPVAPTFTIRRL
jgi:DUF1365 family protein